MEAWKDWRTLKKPQNKKFFIGNQISLHLSHGLLSLQRCEFCCFTLYVYGIFTSFFALTPTHPMFELYKPTDFLKTLSYCFISLVPFSGKSMWCWLCVLLLHQFEGIYWSFSLSSTFNNGFFDLCRIDWPLSPHVSYVLLKQFSYSMHNVLLVFLYIFCHY